MRLFVWVGVFVLGILPVLAMTETSRLTLQLRDNSTGILVNATRELTANLTLSGLNCAGNPATLFSNTSNITSDGVGGVSLRPTPSGLNHTEAYQWCLYRNDTANATVNTTAPFDPVSQAQYAARVSANGTLDDSDLNITRHNASFNWTFVDRILARVGIFAFTDAYADIGNASFRFRDLYLSRNLTDGTRFVTVQNLSDAANVILDYARINATLGTNATYTITDPSGLYQNASNPLTANWATGNFTVVAGGIRANISGVPNGFNVTGNTSHVAMDENGNLNISANTTMQNRTLHIRNADPRGFDVKGASSDAFRIDTVDLLVYGPTMRPFDNTSAYDLGSTTTFWRNLQLRNNLSDGNGYWGSLRNYTTATRYTENVTMAGILLNGTDNVSVSRLAQTVNGSFATDLNLSNHSIGYVGNITFATNETQSHASGPVHRWSANMSCEILTVNESATYNFCV